MKQESIPIQPRENMVDFDLRTYEKDMENNIKLQGFPGDLKKSPKKWLQSTGVFFVRKYFTGLLGFLILFQHRKTFIYMLQTIQACSK